MRESEARIEEAARCGTANDRLVANRLLGDARTWGQWEAEHARLLKAVADTGAPTAQDHALRIGAFTLIHRREPFQYMRDHQLRGEARRQIIAQFHGSSAYSTAMVAEHGQYLRSAGSLICAQHLGSLVFQDAVFQDPLERYEELFREYFAAFCAAALAKQNGASPQDIALKGTLLPLLKYNLSRLRQSILAMPRLTPELAEDIRLRTATGDTARMQRLREI